MESAQDPEVALGSRARLSSHSLCLPHIARCLCLCLQELDEHVMLHGAQLFGGSVLDASADVLVPLRLRIEWDVLGIAVILGLGPG